MTEPRESSTNPMDVETVSHDSAPSVTGDTASATPSRKPLLLTGLVLLVLVTGAFSWLGMQTFGNRARAEKMIERAQEENLPNLWKHARLELEEYLQFPLFSSDGDAQLLLVEALIHDESLTHEDAVKEALTQLRNIPSEAPQGAQARAKEGKLYLMMVHKLGLAESALREAIKLNPKDEESHFLLWKLLELTGRADWSEEIFWRVYELTHPDRRPVRLRQWYMTQFFAPTANLMLERQMGLLGTEEVPSSDNE